MIQKVGHVWMKWDSKRRWRYCLSMYAYWSCTGCCCWCLCWTWFLASLPLFMNLLLRLILNLRQHDLITATFRRLCKINEVKYPWYVVNNLVASRCRCLAQPSSLLVDCIWTLRSHAYVRFSQWSRSMREHQVSTQSHRRRESLWHLHSWSELVVGPLL